MTFDSGDGPAHIHTVRREVIEMIDPAKAMAFLSAGRIAVVGASDDRKNFGRTIVTELTAHGIDTVAVHPHAEMVASAHCYPSLAVVPGTVDGVVVMVPQDASVGVVRECVDRGVTRVWLFKGAGPGAVSEEAVELCRTHGIDVVEGACPLMFLEPVGGVHKFHRLLRRMNGSVAKAA
jgi:hypothetical protein